MSITIAITGQALIHRPLDFNCVGATELLAFLKADAVIGNFEGVVQAEGAWPTKVKTVHAVKPDAIASLARLGFTAMAHANNHAFDLGPPGIAATRAVLNQHGILLAGSGQTLDEATRPVEWSVGERTIVLFSVDLGPQGEIAYAGSDRAGIAPLRMKRSIQLPASDYATIAAIHQALGDEARLRARRRVGYSAAVDQGLEALGAHFKIGARVESEWSVDHDDMTRLTSQLRLAKSQGRIVLLALHNHHWDADWSRTPSWLDRLSEELIDAGADVIIGTGAPVMQPMRLYKGRAIAPGLGNFIFHTARGETYDEEGVDVWRSVAARLTLKEDGHCSKVEIMPISASRLGHNTHVPLPLGGEETREIKKRFWPEG